MEAISFKNDESSNKNDNKNIAVVDDNGRGSSGSTGTTTTNADEHCKVNSGSGSGGNQDIATKGQDQNTNTKLRRQWWWWRQQEPKSQADCHMKAGYDDSDNTMKILFLGYHHYMEEQSFVETSDNQGTPAAANKDATEDSLLWHVMEEGTPPKKLKQQ
ncbi:hypothetical protein ACA910_019488 [Epithemia clementina (nom. ined.)]